MNLKHLFKKYSSDKYTHRYHDIYEKYLSNNKRKKLNILEIGVADGLSLRAWSEYFSKSNIIGIDIKKIDIKKRKINKKNIFFHCGSQNDINFLKEIANIYKKFDIIIDDGSHYPHDVMFSFKYLFNYLDKNGLYFIEDTQTSYNHFFGGNPFDLKYANTHINFFKHLTDSLNFQEIPNPFYKKNKYDGFIKFISFYNNMIVVKKGINNIKSNLVLNNSYENKRYLTKTKRGHRKFRYYLKYKVLFKIYTLFVLLLNFLMKIVFFRY